MNHDRENRNVNAVYCGHCGYDYENVMFSGIDLVLDWNPYFADFCWVIFYWMKNDVSVILPFLFCPVSYKILNFQESSDKKMWIITPKYPK